jgi:hypothetical protein
MIGSFVYSNKAASALVKTGPGTLHSVNLAAAGDAATAIVYDNTAGSGTIIVKLSAAANTSESHVLDVTYSTGLYVALTGTTPSSTLAFQ